MPGERPQTYRIALTIALVVALIAAIFGAMPIAVLVAAFAIPIVYIVYIYDMNLWEDEPIPVVGLAFALTGVLTIGFTILWTFLRGPVPFGTTTLRERPQCGARAWARSCSSRWWCRSSARRSGRSGRCCWPAGRSSTT